MKNLFCIMAIILLHNWANSQSLTNVLSLDLQGKNEAVFESDLSSGFKMNDLSWAWQSAVACFPETQKQKFTGHHVLFVLDIPARTEYEITVIPQEKGKNFSLYTYVVGQLSENNLVPNLASCIRCEADHKWDYKKKGQIQDHTRTVKHILAINNPYQAVIGVVGAEELTTGKFYLKVVKK